MLPTLHVIYYTGTILVVKWPCCQSSRVLKNRQSKYQMWINVIDYRGQDNLFVKRTEVFLKQQQDFHYWQQHGHKFRCFTQHHTDNNFGEYDDVIKIPRCYAAKARNIILDYYPADTWIGIWDNDASLYWNRLDSAKVPGELDKITQQADDQLIVAWAPYNPQTSPYQETLPPAWTFRSTISLKGTMMFLKTQSIRFNETITTLEDRDYACQLTMLGHRVGRLEQAALKEWAASHSTIIGEQKRTDMYAEDRSHFVEAYGDYFPTERLGKDNKFIFKRLSELQRSLWRTRPLKTLVKPVPHPSNLMFNRLFLKN